MEVDAIIKARGLSSAASAASAAIDHVRDWALGTPADGIEVKLLHIDGVRQQAGDRVEVGVGDEGLEPCAATANVRDVPAQ